MNIRLLRTSTVEHEYTQGFVCSACQARKNCTLETLGQDFSKQILNINYYNFGLQFCQEQENGIEFAYEGSSEKWLLEVAEDNKTILFEIRLL